MASEELLNEFEDRELETMEIFLSTQITKTSATLDQFIQTSLAQGVDPDVLRETLFQDLEEGGRIFGEFRRSIQSTARGTVNRLRDSGVYSEFGVERKYRWSAVLVKTCRASGGLDGCIDRHGQSKTWEQWESIGLPRAGRTTCGQNCHCVLLPAETTQLEPVILGAK